ncbi:MAG TPA: hypothetical protein VEB86_07490, partial [Chryseosolibacter sp.]|nr:hypothetical protein [Chryseosolibacter sp.]
ALNAGGMVTRTVKGLPDEKFGFAGYSFYTHNGYSSYFYDLNGKLDYRAFQWGNKDGEPDLFFFNFNGHSGKFYFREDQTPVMIPEGDYKIEPYYKPEDNSYDSYLWIQGFIITAPDGVRYHFGVTQGDTGDTDPIETGAIKNAGDLAEYGNIISSWYLFKVESPDRKFAIHLKYRPEEYSYYTISTSPCLPNCDNKVVPMKIIVLGVALDRIISTSTTISFAPSAEFREDVARHDAAVSDGVNISARALKQIVIQSHNSLHCTVFELSHSYFFNDGPLPDVFTQFLPSLNTDRKRLKLDAIHEFSCNGQEDKPAYTFTYYDENAVPRRLSFGQDHWGYNNGAVTNDNFVPPVSNSNGAAYIENDNREAAWPQMRAGTLRSIRYPTGGGTEYIYEPNQVNTYQCRYEKQDNMALTVYAGMGTANAEYGSPYSLTVNEPTVLYYRFLSNSGGTGRLQVDHTDHSVITEQYDTEEDYIFLPPGTYSFRCYADADNGSGVGVIAHFYTTTSECIEIARMVGGLRIKRIEQFGIGAAPKLVKEFEYSQPYLYSVPVYIFKMKHDIFTTGLIGAEIVGNVSKANPLGCAIFNPGGYAETFISPVSTHPMQATQGYHVGYGSVKEKLPDGGYTVSEFQGALVLPPSWYTLEDVSVRKLDAKKCLRSDPIYPQPPPPYDFQRGQIKSVTTYDANNRKLTQTTFDDLYEQNDLGVFGLMIGSYPHTQTTLPVHYDIRSGRQLSKKIKQRTFHPGHENEFVETEVTQTFGSAFHRMQTIKKTVAGEVTMDEKYTYAPDLTGCRTECASCTETFLASTEQIRQLYLQKLSWCGQSGNPYCGSLLGCDNLYDPCGDVVSCRLCTWTDYQHALNEARKTYTGCIKSCKSSNNCLTNGKAHSNADVRTLFHMDDQNIVATPVESSVWRNGKLSNATYLYHKTFGTDPATIYVDKIFSADILTPSTSFTPISIQSGNVVKDSKYNSAPEIAYVHDQGRIVEVTPRDGLTTAYIWGHNQTLPLVKAIGISYPILRAAYDADPANVRTNPALAKAHLTTYEWEPALGIVKTIDPNGRSQMYEYDQLGRLLRIKDHNGKILEQYEYHYQLD